MVTEVKTADPTELSGISTFRAGEDGVRRITAEYVKVPLSFVKIVYEDGSTRTFRGMPFVSRSGRPKEEDVPF